MAKLKIRKPGEKKTRSTSNTVYFFRYFKLLILLNLMQLTVISYSYWPQALELIELIKSQILTLL